MKSIDIFKKPLAVLVSAVLGIVSPEKWLALTLNCVFTVIWGTPFSDPFFSQVIHPIVSSLTGICSILNLKNMLCAQVLRAPPPPSLQ